MEQFHVIVRVDGYEKAPMIADEEAESTSVPIEHTAETMVEADAETQATTKTYWPNPDQQIPGVVSPGEWEVALVRFDERLVVNDINEKPKLRGYLTCSLCQPTVVFGNYVQLLSMVSPSMTPVGAVKPIYRPVTVPTFDQLRLVKLRYTH